MKVSDYEPRTNVQSTPTAEGNIPHLKLKSGLLCPVKLTKRKTSKNLPFPMKTPGGYFIYAFPGGQEITLDPEVVK